MKQPLIKFLLYFSRFAEVRKIKTKQRKVLRDINSSELIKESDKTKISELVYKLANPKGFFLVAPIKTSAKEIPFVRKVQDIIASYLPLAKSQEEYTMLEKSLQATNDYFRYHEIFEQNVLFCMFIIVALTIIISPIIFTYI